MACKVIFKPNGKEIASSILVDQVTAIANKYPHLVLKQFNEANPELEIEDISEITEDIQDVVIEDMLSYFRSPYFIRNFGEWEVEGSNIPEDFVNEKGEPNLLIDPNNGKSYHKSKFGEKIYFPMEQNGLNSIPGFNNSRIGKAVQVLGKKFFMRNFNLDYSDLSFVTEKDFESEIRDIILEKINEELAEDPESVTAYDLNQSLNYMNEWTELLQTYFKSIGFKVEDKVDEDTDEEVGGSEELIKKASYTTDSKDKISTNVKLLLSVIEDTNEDNIDYIFEENGFVDFNDIYNTILNDINGTTVIEESKGNISDAYDTMLSKIKELAVRKPYLNSLIDVLEDTNYPDSKKTEFFQAFYLSKNNFFVTEIDVQEYGLTHVVKNVSESNKKFNVIKESWYTNFKDVLKIGSDAVSYQPIKDSIQTLENTLKTYKKSKKTITDIETVINDLLESLNNIGVEIDAKAVEGEYTKALSTNTFGVVLQDVGRIQKVFEEIMTGEIPLTENVFNTQDVFSRLAKQKAFYEPDSSDNSINSAGKSYWAYSYPSHIQNEVNKWKAPNGRYELDKATTLLGNESSVLLKHLTAQDQQLDMSKDITSKKRLETFKVGIFNVLQNKKTERRKSDPKDNTNLSKNDAVSNSLNQALRIVKEGESTSLFYTPTPADKATAYVMQHDFFVKSNLSAKEGKFNFSEEVLDIYYDYFKSEYKRMIQAYKELSDDSVQKVVHYHTVKGAQYAEKDGDDWVNFNNEGVGYLIGNAFKSQLFPSLSPENVKKGSPLYTSQGEPALTLKALDQHKTAVKNKINSILQQKLKETKDNLVKAGVFTEFTSNDGVSYLRNKGVDSTIFYTYAKSEPKTETKAYTVELYNLISDYFVNTSINLIEYSKMFSGDPAYYKNMVDYSKRIPATYTDGLGLRIKSVKDQYFTASVIAGVEVPSPYLKELEDTVGPTIAKMYKKNNTTDAQAWITPQRWEFLVRNLGLWTTTHDSAFDKIMGKNKEPFTEKEKKAVAQPLKGVYFSRDTTNLKNAGRPTYLKYSQAVLLPGLIKGSPLERVYDKMQEKGIDELITIDGVKAGAISPETIHNADGTLADEFDLNTYELDNRGWKLQQNLPTKTTKDTNVGSQIQKNALMGLANFLDESVDGGSFNVNGEMTSGQEVYDGLNEVIGALSDKGVEDIKKELEISDDFKINNIDGLYDMLLKDAKSKGIGNQNLIRAIEKNISIYGMPGSKEKLLNMFFSIVKDRAVKVKTNGGSMIQMANFGLDSKVATQNTGIKWLIDPGKGLKPPLIADVEVTDKDGNVTTVKKIKPGQILLPGTVISKQIPNWAEIPAEELKKMIDPEILNGLIGYRIPNQGLSSNDSLEIVGFLPEGMGDAVVAYSEIPTKTGSDFDIDKMFMMIPSFRTILKGKAIKTLKQSGLNNKIALSILDNLGVKYVNKDRAVNTVYELYQSDPKSIPEGIREALDAVKEVSMQTERLEYIKPRLDENGVELPATEQSKDALKNKLIQYYKSIFTHPEVVKDVMTPIDFDFVKDHITAMFPEQEGKDLDNFDMVKQMDTKYLFISGKAGVGLTANALVDFVRGLFYTSKINNFNVNGKLGKQGETLFDTEYSEELTNKEAKEFVDMLDGAEKEGYTVENIKKLKTSHSISAFLNAYVDIAKDPYVTRGNWTTQTSNVGFLLLRAGIHPFKVNAFMGQPIIKGYIDFITNTEAKIGEDVGDAKIAFLQKYLTDQAKEIKITLQKNGNPIEYTYHDFFKELNINKSKEKFNPTTVLTNFGVPSNIVKDVIKQWKTNKEIVGIIRDPKALAKMLENRTKSFNQVTNLNEYSKNTKGYSNPEFQITVIQDFYDLLDKAKKMNNLAKSAKPDVTGPGKNLTSLMIIDNLTQNLKDKSGEEYEFTNIEDRYEVDGKKTILGHYFNNSIEFPKKVVESNPNLFFTGSKKVNAVYNDISNMVYGETLTNNTLGDVLNAEFYTYMMSGFEQIKDPKFFEETKENLINVIEQYQENVKTAKENDEVADSNFLLDNLEVKSDITTKGVNGKKVETVEKYLVLNRSLKGEDVQNKLYYAWKDMLEATGEDAGIFNYIADNLIKYSFYQSGFNMNRNQFFTSIPHEFFVKNEFNQYVRNISKSSNSFSNFTDQFFKHNWKNDAIVPSYTFDNKSLSTKEIKGGVLLTNTSKTKKLKPFIKVGPLALLAKFKGVNKQGQGIYMYTNKLGQSNEFGNFSEYNFDMMPKNSIFADNKPSSELIKKGREWFKSNPPSKTEFDYYALEDKVDYSKVEVTEEVPPGVETVEQTVEVVDRYSNEDLKANPNKIYVFGDNMTREGKGGQAAIRGNENAVGIATKMQPNTAKEAYFKDSDLERNKERIDDDIRILKLKSERKTIVFPKDGLGTGLAKLKEKAPKTYDYLKQRLLEEFRFNNDTGQTGVEVVEQKVEPGTQLLNSVYLSRESFSFKKGKLDTFKLSDNSEVKGTSIIIDGQPDVDLFVFKNGGKGWKVIDTKSRGFFQLQTDEITYKGHVNKKSQVLDALSKNINKYATREDSKKVLESLGFKNNIKFEPTLDDLSNSFENEDCN